MKQYRHICLLFLFAGILRIDLWAQSGSLEVEIEKDSLEISAHQLNFLTDGALEKLHNGLTVHLTIDLTVVKESSGKPLYRAKEEFAFSFDLWEEKYSVFHSPPDGESISHLSASSAEGWCLKNIPIPLEVIPDGERFMIELECSFEENRDGGSEEDEPGLSIGGLIEFFSRKKDIENTTWKASTGLLRLNELKSHEFNNDALKHPEQIR